MTWYNEIYDFGDAWRGTQNFKVTPVGNFIFVADVVYESRSRGTEVSSCTVQITRNGFDDGKIEIFPKGKLQNESHHLAFSEKWQTYEFDLKTNSLIVTGKSPKMGGEYKVILSPNGTEPSFL